MKDEQFATAFGTAAHDYERGRPGYPPEAIDALVRDLCLERRSVVVDLAAGTGKLTRDLTRRFDAVIAIEPLAEMRQQLARTAPAAKVLDGTAERVPLPDASADAVFVAQAFHWFDGRRALDEIARVLRPGGGLALLWNTTPWERRESAWFARLDDALERSRADLSAMRRHGTGAGGKRSTASPGSGRCPRRRSTIRSGCPRRRSSPVSPRAATSPGSIATPGRR